MHGFDSGLTQLEFDIEIEIRGIDADKNIRFGSDQVSDQFFRRARSSRNRPSTSTRPITERRSIGK